MNPDVSRWPDSIDGLVTFAVLALFILLPVAGYVAMAADIGAYLRSLRRGLILVASLGQETPWWAQRDRGACLRSFGLTVPFTEAELMRAYRERVKELHPDRGGDRKHFLRLQTDFEQALKLLESQSPGEKRPARAK